ncbi:TolC family protein [Massilia luteola]|uniref:TolC family protein n=1 Tax=Massilia luteola TaxID=3081751 RepID=UPI002ACC2D9D|nr:TolC family protein [Massilia sp. Gc5]
MPPARFLPAAAALALLAGCTTVTPDGGFDDVAAATRHRIGVTPQLARDDAGQGALAPSLRALPVFAAGAPLDMDTAVRIALVNHPGLQATYWNVGIAQADLAQAARPRNPSFDFKRLASGGALEIERGITFDLVGMLTAPLAARMEARRFEQVKREVGAAIERHALETRTAWIEAVASKQALDYARRVQASSAAGAELAGRMARAGTTNQLELAREQVLHAQAASDVARAARRATAARERLTRALGLWGKDAGYALPDHLPDLPAAPAELADVERIALEQRLDVQAAKAEASATAADLGLTRTTRFVDVLDAGYADKSDTGAARQHGYTLSLELPLFDWGGARVARAEATYMQAVNRVALTAVTARSEAREGYLAYRNAYDVARHYRDTIIPLRKKIGHEVLLRYNGMLASPQDLLADARAQAEAVGAYIEALDTFWTAHAALEATLGTRLNPQQVNSQNKDKTE